MLVSIDNPQLLTNTYEKYHNRFFKEKTFTTAGVIGSSDSLYIDSLFHELQKTDAAATFPKKKSTVNALPWVVLPSDSLPETILSNIDSLKFKLLSQNGWKT